MFGPPSVHYGGTAFGAFRPGNPLLNADGLPSRKKKSGRIDRIIQRLVVATRLELVTSSV